MSMSTRSGFSEPALGDALGASHGLDHGVARKRKRNHEGWCADPPGPRRLECACSCGTVGGCGAHGQLHAERRALTDTRLDPNAPAVHLDNLFRNRKTKPRA